jgi:integrase
VLLARRGEFDLYTKTWTIRKERMKSGHEHIVPLSDRAAAIVAAKPIRHPGRALNSSRKLAIAECRAKTIEPEQGNRT